MKTRLLLKLKRLLPLFFSKFFWRSTVARIFAIESNLIDGESNRTICCLPKIIAMMFGLIVLTSYNAFAQTAPNQGLAPVQTPHGGFAVDGDAYANTPTFTPYTNGGDWFQNLTMFPGTGGGLMNLLTGKPLDTTMTFFLQDVWTGTDPTTFTSSNKINDDPNTYTWGPGLNPNKNEIQNAGVHFTYGDPALGGNPSDLWCVFAADRQVTNGSSYIDFEFFQKPLTMTGTTSGGFISAGTQGGRTVGDILVTIEFTNGGAAAGVEVQRWQAVGTSFGYVYVIVNRPLTDTVFITENTVPTTVPFDVYGSGVPGTYAVNQWAEGAINITAILDGIANPCRLLSTVFIRTRTSGSSHTSELKDFPGAPIQLNLILNPADLVLTGSKICTSAGNTGTVSSTTSEIGISYQLYNSSNDPVQSAKTGTGSVLTWTGLATGNYHVVSTDPSSANCPGSSNTATVTLSTNPTSSVTKTNVLCNGGNSGAINLTVSGGTSPYSYLWSNAATTEDLSLLQTGTYSVTITDANGCTATNSATITEPTLLTSSETHVNVLCNEGNNGAIDLTVSGGTSPYSYLWSNAAITEDLNSLTAGTYSVTITDANGCTASDTITVTQPALLTSSETHINILCNEGNNGSIDLTISGGTSPYSYLWSNAATSEDLNSLTAGTYSVTITDANACTSSDTITITQPPLLTSSESHVNILCNEGINGSIDLTVNGGTPPYKYLWSNKASTEDLNLLPAGEYSAIITDSNGCVTTNSVIITQPSSLQSGFIKTDPLCFNGSDGTIDLTVSGGTAPYSYLWSNAAITEDLSALSAGTYSVTITDANGCLLTDSIIITQPPLLTTSETHINVLCYSDKNGSIDLTVYGGTPPYNFLWVNPSVSGSSEDLHELAAGLYSVTVADANGCNAINSITITEPPKLTSNETHVNILCTGGSNGSIDLTVSGGTSPYSFFWTNSATTQDLNALIAGTYFVSITDANGCTASNSVTITEPGLLNSSETHVNVSCNGDNDGSIDLTVLGGTSPYTFIWSNGATSEDLSSLTAGIYSVAITDANGCTAHNTVKVPQPAALTSSETHVNVLCNGGNSASIDLTVSGGTLPYAFLWSNTAITEDLSSLSAGTYSITITDANGCIAYNNITITEPLQLQSTYTKINPSCFDGSNGSIDLTVSGGTLPYAYLWSNAATTEDLNSLSAGTYSVTITDANGCTATNSVSISDPPRLTSSETHINILCNGGNNGSANLTVSGGTPPYTYLWSNAATTEDLSSLTTGVYSVTITDANECKATNSLTITEPSTLQSGFTKIDPSCFEESDGSIDLTVSGGTPPYTYLWSNAATTEDLNSISARTYSVTVTDANGCTSVISITINQPPLLTSSETHVNVLCYGGNSGSLDLTVSGGTPPYAYLWSNTATTEDLSSLTVGTYSVNITDANGCKTSNSIIITEPSQLQLTLTKNDQSCYDGSDGSITATVTGGTPEYAYLWSNASTAPSIAGLTPGTYSVVVTDANGCSISGFVSIAPLPCNDFLTFTQGGWGADPSGKNPGTYLISHFSEAFPSGLTVGYATNLLSLTSPKAIRDFLPSGSTPAILPAGTMTNPGLTYNNVLAGQVVALSLNVSFDLYYPLFAPSEINLGSLIIGKGIFTGQTVSQLLLIANQALGGMATTYTLSEINDAIAMINENYDNGKINKEFLFCPCNIISSATGTLNTGIIENSEQKSFNQSAFNCYPNPLSTEVNIQFTLTYDSEVRVEIYSLSGELVTTAFNKQVTANQQYNFSQNCANMREGIYFFKLITTKENLIKRLLIER